MAQQQQQQETRRGSVASDPGDHHAFSVEYYGYVVYALSLLSWVAYMVWALAPGLFESVGITYLPDRYWALALPSWGIITACFVWLFLQLHILYHTPDRHSSATLTDSFARVQVPEATASADLYDLPIESVCKHLFKARNDSNDISP